MALWRHMRPHRRPCTRCTPCYYMFNPLSKSRKLPALGRLKLWRMRFRGAARRAFIFIFKYIAADFRHTSQPRESRNFATAANCHSLRAAARYVACAWSWRCRARPNVETLQSCKHTASTGPGKRDRIAGFVTLLPPHAASCASPPPAKRPALAPGCVEHGQASARAKPAHTRHPWGLAKRKNHRRWR